MWLLITPFRLLKLTLPLLWLRMTGKLTEKIFAVRIREFLEVMGGLWIKAGQLISLRRDAFSKELCDELAKLLDQTRAFPAEDVLRIIEEELGSSVDELFEKFEPRAFAAASIGQLHMARIRGQGVRVAVKVQRPHIERRFHQQMFFISAILKGIEKFGIVPQIKANECISELVQLMTEEVDYRLEASNIRRMRKTLRKHKILAPKDFFRYTGRRVLAMEYVEGVLMSDYISLLHSDPPRVHRWRLENNVDPVVVAHDLNDSILRQIVEDNLFHADPHPGNIVLLRDSWIAFLDFGSIGFLETDYLRKYTLFLRCLAGNENSKAADVFFLMCNLPVIDIEGAKSEMVRCLKAWENRTKTSSLSYHERSINSLHEDFFRVLHRYEIPGNWLFLKLDRASVTLDASLMHLCPDMDYPKLIRDYFERAQSRKLNWDSRLENQAATIMNFNHAMSSVPDLLREYRLFYSSIWRRDALLHQARETKFNDLLTFVSRNASRLVGLAGVVLVAVFLEQRYPAWIEPLGGQTLRSVAQQFPQFGAYAWVLILFVVFYMHHSLRTMIKRLSEEVFD